MIEKELFYKIADTNFHVFDVASEDDIKNMFSEYPDKERIRNLIKEKLNSNSITIDLPEKVTIELYLLLTEFCLKNKISLLETCSLFKILSDILILFRQNKTKKEVYEQFKKSVLTFSMNRFSNQIGILQKETVYKISNFFIDVIYKRYYMLHYSLTNEISTDLYTTELSTYSLPPVESLAEATEVLPRNSKILRQYFESRRPKTELEQKIEIVLDFERNRLDKQMEKIFAEQDEVFKNKVDELLKKKK